MGNFSTKPQEAVLESIPELTAGIDLGDRISHYTIIDRGGCVVEQGTVRSNESELEQHFNEGRGKMRIAIETGTHCLWVSRLLGRLGQEVIVANARKVSLIGNNGRKSDERDSELLARLARVDVSLLHPVQVRDERRQADLQTIKLRQSLVKARSQLVCTVRSIFKSRGESVKRCSTEAFSKSVRGQIYAGQRGEMEPLLVAIEQLSEQIKFYDQKIEWLSRERYPETEVLRQIPGVGPITGLAFVLTLKSPHWYRKNRDAGPYLGLCPRRDQSGDKDPELRISKAGDRMLRCLLINCAHYILRGPECDLKEFGTRLAAKGGKKAKKRAVVAVARKLAVLLMRLWRTGEVYDPEYNRKLSEVDAA